MAEKVVVEIPGVESNIRALKDMVKTWKSLAQAQDAVAKTTRKAGSAARSASQSAKSAASAASKAAGATRVGAQSSSTASVDPDKTQVQSVKDQYRMKAQYARAQARQQAADQKAAAKAAKQAQQNDPDYIRKQAMLRARYTYGKNGKIQAHLLGVDIKRLVNSGQGAFVHQVMGGNDPQGGGGIDPTSMGLNVAGAAAGVGGTAGQGVGGAVSSAHAVAMALSGLGKLGPYAMAAAVVLKGLGNAAEYATKRVEGEARAGMGYDPLLEKFGAYGGAAGYTGVAAAAAAKAGINPVGGPYGNIDYAGNKRKELKYIGDAPSFEEARRRDIELHGQETGAAKFWDLSPEQKRAALGDPASGNAARNVARRQSHNRASEQWDRFMGHLNDNAGSAADGLINDLMDDPKKFADFVWGGIQGPYAQMIGGKGAAGSIGGRPSIGSGAKSADLKDALDKATQAMNDNTRAIEYSTQGFSSNVPGAEGAVPRGLRNNINLQSKGMDMATANEVRLNTGL